MNYKFMKFMEAQFEAVLCIHCMQVEVAVDSLDEVLAGRHVDLLKVVSCWQALATADQAPDHEH
jgi:hypothetical protein